MAKGRHFSFLPLLIPHGLLHLMLAFFVLRSREFAGRFIGRQARRWWLMSCRKNTAAAFLPCFIHLLILPWSSGQLLAGFFMNGIALSCCLPRRFRARFSPCSWQGDFARLRQRMKTEGRRAENGRSLFGSKFASTA